MASGLKLRSAGARKAAPRRARDLVGPAASLGIGSGERQGERRLNHVQMHALQNLFESHSAIAAARTILQGQLLSGGLVLQRGGEAVELQGAFKAHLDEVWIEFAREVVDSFLKFGFCVFVYEEDNVSSIRQRIKMQRRGPHSEVPTNLIPVVPALDTFELAFLQGGRAGYRRDYVVYSTAPNMATRIDEEANVCIRQHCDGEGNINSPMSSVFEMGSFSMALSELAMTAEVANSRPRLWTQLQKETNKGGLDPQSLFFDSESRSMAAGAEGEENASNAAQLAMQQKMCMMINRLQHFAAPSDHNLNSFSGGGSNQRHSHVPAEVPPSLFCLPKGQEMAPASGQAPQSRGDFEALQRLTIESFCAAFGVPADLIFQGRYAGKSSSQLALLNTTVGQLAKSVNKVLTRAYRDIYNDDSLENDAVTLSLVTAPLAATEEVVQLFTAGLAPCEIAMPAVLTAIGASTDEIERAVKKVCEAEAEAKTVADEDRAAQKVDRDLSIRERESALKSSKTADVEKTPKEAKQ